MMITAFHQIEVVMLALVITTLCCGSIIVFAMQTKYDITRYASSYCRFWRNSRGSLPVSGAPSRANRSLLGLLDVAWIAVGRYRQISPSTSLALLTPLDACAYDLKKRTLTSLESSLTTLVSLWAFSRPSSVLTKGASWTSRSLCETSRAVIDQFAPVDLILGF